jgi:hypothetical protein
MSQVQGWLAEKATLRGQLFWPPFVLWYLSTPLLYCPREKRLYA